MDYLLSEYLPILVFLGMASALAIILVLVFLYVRRFGTEELV